MIIQEARTEVLLELLNLGYRCHLKRRNLAMMKRGPAEPNGHVLSFQADRVLRSSQSLKQ